MTDNGAEQPPEPLPNVVRVTTAFMQRAPSQRAQDLLLRLEGGTFGELMERQGFRVAAFRKLSDDYPGHDPTSVWMHAYDVEVEISEVDPTGSVSATLTPPSAAITVASPGTSTS
jgi:hypothetical protein